MKLKNIFLPMLTAFACIAMTTSCDSDDEWTPGPQVVNEYQVYFKTDAKDLGELKRGQTVDVPLIIAREDSTKAASVPITVKGNSDLFELPATIDFAANEGTKTFNVHFKGTQQTDEYKCVLYIDDPTFSNPYTSSFVTSVTLNLMVVEWEVYAENVHFTAKQKSSPDFDAQLLKAIGRDDLYRFNNFMANYNLTFNVKKFGKGNYYIKPKRGFHAPDWFDWGYDDCWHMGDDADNTWILYYNGDDSGNYYAFCFFMLDTDTFINFDEHQGQIKWDYSLYDANDNYVKGQWDYLMFNWE